LESLVGLFIIGNGTTEIVRLCHGKKDEGSKIRDKDKIRGQNTTTLKATIFCISIILWSWKV
jgi:hypothetical protein